MTVEEKEMEEVGTEDLCMYDMLITDNIDFRVETRPLHTNSEDGSMKMENHEATIRINNDGTEIPLWVVGSRYEVVDHREVIKGFAHALDSADLQAEVDHKVYGNGCRIFSIFTLNQSFDIGKGKRVNPFFSLTTSHDGSLKLGFMIGAKLDDTTYLNVSKTVYGAFSKHTRGVNVGKTLREISKALKAFVNEIIPMWKRMQDISTSTAMNQEIIDRAVKRNIIAQRRAENINIGSCNNVFDVYTSIVSEVCKVKGKKATEERAFDRNTKVGEFFRGLYNSKALDEISETTTKESV